MPIPVELHVKLTRVLHLKFTRLDYLNALNSVVFLVPEVGHPSMQISAAIGSILGAIQQEWVGGGEKRCPM
jgi:hypothetical protein